MKILVTGGTGFIGSHVVVELLNANYDVVIIDNFSNSDPIVLSKISQICNKKYSFYEGDVSDEKLLNHIFKKENINAVIHLAGYKAVGESVSNPLKYYENNLISTIKLVKVMLKFNVKNLIFSSSATVYGKAETLPIKEDAPLSASNPYGYTKLMNEKILTDISKANNLNVVLLRYFNPVGAHESGLIGEDPKGIPNNIMPYIMKVATGEIEKFHIYGNDYDTIDGTGVRDYIHIVDLAKGHVKAIEYAQTHSKIKAFNLGTGNGYSVMQLIKAVEKVNNIKIPYVIEKRREGDVASCYADPSLANKELNWKAEKTLNDICRDAYTFALKNQKNN